MGHIPRFLIPYGYRQVQLVFVLLVLRPVSVRYCYVPAKILTCTSRYLEAVSSVPVQNLGLIAFVVLLNVQGQTRRNTKSSICTLASPVCIFALLASWLSLCFLRPHRCPSLSPLRRRPSFSQSVMALMGWCRRLSRSLLCHWFALWSPNLSLESLHPLSLKRKSLSWTFERPKLSLSLSQLLIFPFP